MPGGRADVGTLVPSMSCSGSKATNFSRGGGLQPISADEKSITVYSPGQEDTPGGRREDLRPVTTTTTTTATTRNVLLLNLLFSYFMYFCSDDVLLGLDMMNLFLCKQVCLFAV